MAGTAEVVLVTKVEMMVVVDGGGHSDGRRSRLLTGETVVVVEVVIVMEVLLIVVVKMVVTGRMEGTVQIGGGRVMGWVGLETGKLR